MYLNLAFLRGRSGAGRLMFTSCILMLIFALSIGSSAQGGGTLIVGTNAPINLDPASGSNDPEVMFNSLIYDRLLDIAPDNSIVPNLATEYTISDDGLTYTLTLAEGVTFHDGSPFTSADVVFTFNRLKALQSPALGLLAGGSFEVSAPDDTTVVFTLTEPNADFLYGLAGRLTGIIKNGTELVNMVSEDTNRYSLFNGTGPFILTEYAPDERAIFTRNENYFKDGQPQLDGVTMVFINDPLAQIDALRTGEVNFIFKLPVDQIANLEGEEGITILQKPTNQHPVIRLRSDEGHLGEDVRVRQAFKYATNRDELNDVLLEGLGVVGNNNPIGPAYGNFYDDAIEEPGYDPEQACALILEATGEERLAIDFYVVDSFNYSDLATVIQQQWQEGCIDANILVRPEGVYYADTEWLEVDLGMTGWGDRPIPHQYLVEAYITGGIYNEAHWSTEALDALIAEAGRTTDQEARAELYSQIAQIFAEEGPIIIPFFAPMVGAVTDNVQGLEMASFPGLTDLRNVTVASE
jgi:peptide/nickel transport system substrate-binding protein